jgi:hypothetical protein
VAPQPLARKASLSEAELLQITREATDTSERRLRSFDNYERALASAPSAEQVDEAQRAADAFAPLVRQREQLSKGSSRRKTTKLRQTRREHERALAAQAHLDSLKQRRSLIQKHRASMPDREREDERAAAAEWVHGEERQSAPVRTLSDWKADGASWQERNRRAGRKLAPGEVLRTEKGWSDAVNQGWMQGGYDRGAAFRLLTPVPDQVESMHNRYARASKPSAVDYDTRLTHWAMNRRDTYRQLWSPGPSGTPLADQRKSFFAQELVDAAGSGYVIHRDAADRQVLMPRAKSDLLGEVRARGRAKPDTD